MKGLRKYLTPFAPDQSGAVSVLFELGGLIVICDAGGCTGNICGFDEPRWRTMRSAVFSAGLRDMDAILGRDELLTAEIAAAAAAIEPRFIALIGTPVPAVIGTDYAALRRVIEKQTGIPALTIDTNGTELFDRGAEKAYCALMQRFPQGDIPRQKGLTGVLGANPLEMSDLRAADRIRQRIPGAVCYGMDSDLADIRAAGAAESNIVCAPSGLRAARLLRDRFGTPFAVTDPLAEELLPEQDYTAKRILIVEQQVRAVSMRKILLAKGASAVTCATWFMQHDELALPGDAALFDEDDLERLIAGGQYDILIADPAVFRIAADTFDGQCIGIRQFPVSGKMVDI